MSSIDNTTLMVKFRFSTKHDADTQQRAFPTFPYISLWKIIQSLSIPKSCLFSTPLNLLMCIEIYVVHLEPFGFEVW